MGSTVTLMSEKIGRDGLDAAPTRRIILSAGAIAALAAALTPHMVFATPAAVEAELRKLLGDRKPMEGKIKLDLPAIAENGMVVPLTVDIDSPMTDADHVKAVHLFADGNPLPGVGTFRFTPASGKASVATRIRLAQTQEIICVAEMADGTVHMARQQVRVTIGGCGG